MDVFHKVLVRIHEVTGGRENQDVDFVELLKAEGFFPSLESIKSHLGNEGWIADSPRPDNIRITHWGNAEAKKALASPGESPQDIDRHTKRLLSAARDFSIVVEEFTAKPNDDTFRPVEDKFSDLEGLISRIKKMV